MKKLKKTLKQGLVVILPLLLGGVLGVLLAKYVPLPDDPAAMLWALALLYIAYFLQTIIHEAGHLVFGLLTGYQFTSFRVSSLMWIRTEGRIRFKRYSLAGTGGQCLMRPPQLVDGQCPTMLYNLGGSIMNVIAALVCILLLMILPDNWAPDVFLVLCAGFGIISALLNGIPMKNKLIINDGWNALYLRKDPESLRSFWQQLEMNALMADGKGLLDMPGEWFEMPPDDALKNPHVAQQAVFACNLLMEQRRFEDADAQMQRILGMETGIIGVNRNLLTCDRIYCLLLKGDKDAADALLTKQQKQFMKAMRRYPSVIRTEYTLALLRDRNPKAAGQIAAQFEKISKTYPYPVEIKSESLLMDIANEKAT